jgi:hypothetical protein
VLRPKAAVCVAVDEMPAPRGCVQTPDGSGVDCEMGDVPPDSWGDCVESKDQQFSCEKAGVITHYDEKSRRTWSEPAASCPALAEQIRRDHPRHVIEVPIVPVEPEAPRKPTREKI